MQPIPPRIIAHIWTTETYTAERIASLRTRIARDLEAQGRALVDLLLDRGYPKGDPVEHESLRRIAKGEADGVMLMRLPVTMTGEQSRDVLLKHLDGPIRFLNAAELAELGLLPGGTRYKPHRTLTDAARLAAALHAAGMPLRAIASHLDAEGFCTARGGNWHAATVTQLLERFAQDDEQPASESTANTTAS